MADLGNMQTRVRTALEDAGATQLWTTDEINEALRVELDNYSALNPDQAVSMATAADGDLTIALPSGATEIVRVSDPYGAVIPERAPSPARYVANEEQAWEVFAGSIRFARQLNAGDYTLWYRTFRTFPALSTDTFPVPEQDTSLIVAGAVLWALDFRAREEWKRGALPARYQLALDRARLAYERLWEGWRRRVRTGSVRVSG